MWLPGYGLWLAACIAAQTDMPDRAAYLFGGAQQQLRRNGVLVERMLPLWQLQQQAQKTARRQMGDDQFDTQFQRGESSRYEDVMQQALTPVARPLVEEAPIDQESVLGGLTPREQQVAELVARDLRNRAIADELGISVRTVEYFVASLISKLDAGGRVGVAVKYAEWRARRALHNNSHGESPARAPRPSPTSLLADQKRIT
jgi:DNA-binding CsgD family transcriptional regulator